MCTAAARTPAAAVGVPGSQSQPPASGRPSLGRCHPRGDLAPGSWPSPACCAHLGTEPEGGRSLGQLQVIGNSEDLNRKPSKLLVKKSRRIPPRAQGAAQGRDRMSDTAAGQGPVPRSKWADTFRHTRDVAGLVSQERVDVSGVRLCTGRGKRGWEANRSDARQGLGDAGMRTPPRGSVPPIPGARHPRAHGHP